MPLKLKLTSLSNNVLWATGIGALGYLGYKLLFGTATMDEKGIPDFNSLATRETRAKNLLGVSKSAQFDWANVDLTYPGRANKNNITDALEPGVDNLLGDHLMVFQTTQDGLNAAAWLLHDNYFKGGVSDTPETLGNIWAGDTQHKAAVKGITSYGDAIAQIMGDAATYKMVYGADGPHVMAALAREENGSLQVHNVPFLMYQTAILYGET